MTHLRFRRIIPLKNATFYTEMNTQETFSTVDYPVLCFSNLFIFRLIYANVREFCALICKGVCTKVALTRYFSPLVFIEWLHLVANYNLNPFTPALWFGPPWNLVSSAEPNTSKIGFPNEAYPTMATPGNLQIFVKRIIQLFFESLITITQLEGSTSAIVIL
jgi:hypothetical protein